MLATNQGGSLTGVLTGRPWPPDQQGPGGWQDWPGLTAPAPSDRTPVHTEQRSIKNIVGSFLANSCTHNILT